LTILKKPIHPNIEKTSIFDMKLFDRNFWANGSSVVWVYGVCPESRMIKLSNGGNLAPNDPYYNEKLASKNGHFSKRKIVINAQPLGIFQRKFYHLSFF
jgi:hypothetical protein